MTKVIYYTTIQEENPVETFIDSLQKQQKAKIFRIIQYIELYGLQSALPHVKKLTGTALWEIRILGQDSIRVLYVVMKLNEILLVHGFIKKRQKTPQKEIEIALNRTKDWQKRLNDS
jgi:phage-related protein